MPTRALRDDEGRILRRLDVRADALDIRDRLYMPQLVQLPGRFPGTRWLKDDLPKYAKKFVADQGDTLACTGFGLAAVIGYLLFAERSRNLASTDPLEDRGPRDERVSPWMLYRLARVYDGWDGEERGGSSCRGAMKGWHKHGACRLELWPEYGKAKEAAVGGPTYKGAAFDRPAPVAPWQQDATQRPLGAYYRINRNSVRDIQSAIHQVGAVFASARIHGGWRRLDAKSAAGGFPLIPAGTFSGGHAFALMGYNEVGFLVQNSWGRGWGREGFALLPYEDWSANAMDAWVAVLGAPVSVGLSGRTKAGDGAVARGGYRLRAGESLLSVNTRATAAAVLSADGATEVRAADESWADVLTLAVGTEGRAKRQDINDLRVERQYGRRLVEWPEAAFEGGLPERVVLYFDGGLSEEAAATRRARAMAPLLHANGAYPLFYRWETGLRGAARQIAEGVYRDAFGADAGGGHLDRLKAETSERLDRFVETYCRSGPPKSLWGELKRDAAKAAGGGYASALRLVADGLAALQARRPKLEIHLVAHSAGSLAAGELLKLMGRRGRKGSTAKSLTLWAPACSLNFACTHFVAALEKGTLGSLHVDTLSDELESADEVARAYGKSLLCLVSRSLEDRHKEPLLGLEKTWRDLRRAKNGDLTDPDNDWASDPRGRGRKWDPDGELTLPSEFKTFADWWAELGVAITHAAWTGPSVVEESGGRAVRTAARTHGSFEGDVPVFNALLKRVTGREPAVPAGRLDF